MPLIDQMLLQRQNALKEIEKVFGYHIEVRLSSSWAVNADEEEAELEKLENEAEGGAEDVGPEEAAGDIQSDGWSVSEAPESDRDSVGE